MQPLPIVQPSPLLRLLPWLVAGILAEHELALGWGVWPFGVCVVLSLLAHRWPWVQSLGIGLCMLLLGMLFTAKYRAAHTFSHSDDWQVVEAIVISEAVEKPKTVAIDLLLTDNHRRLKAYLYKDERSMALLPGEGLLLRTRIEPTDSLRLGTFDYGHYLLVNGFTGRCFVRSGDWQRKTVGWGTMSAFDRVRLRALQWRHTLLQRYRAMASDSSPTVYALVAAMTLGDKGALSRETRDVYSVTGTSHILALSGLHMGMLFGFISLFSFFGRRFVVTTALMVALFWAFALLTGLSVSVVRSALMMSVAIVCTLRAGPTSTLNVLCLAALVILLASPFALFDVGFQLSFLSVLAIIMLMPVFGSFMPAGFRKSHRYLHVLCSMVAVAVAAQVGTAPLVAYHFGCLSLCFVLSNLVAVPCAYAILCLGLCSLLLPFRWLGWLLFAVAGTMDSVLTIMASWPGASISGLHPTALQTMLVYVLIVLLYLLVVRLRGLRVRL